MIRIDNLNGQSFKQWLSFPDAGLTGFSQSQVNAFSQTGNCASLASVKNLCFGAGIERRFLVEALSYYKAVVACPSKLGNFGVIVNYDGFRDFNESNLAVLYAKKLTKKLDAGIQFNYYGYKIPGYRGGSAITVDGGIVIHMTDQFHAGIQVCNPVGGKIGKERGEKVPAVYKFGMGYEPSKTFFAAIEIHKEEDHAVNGIAFFQYSFAEKLTARLGVSTETTLLFGGAGLSWKNIRLCVSGSYHPQLGITPGFQFLVNGKQKK